MTVKEIIEIAVLLILFIVFIIWLIFIIHDIKLANRFKNHIVKTPHNESISLIDKLFTWYDNRKKEISDAIISVNRGKKIDKKKDEVDISNLIDSILIGILFYILYLALSIFYIKNITIISSIIAFLFGFTLPGIIYLVKQTIRKKDMEKKIIRVIILINTNLSAGKSIKEALIDTKNKIDGELKQELELVINDLNSGLSLNIAFNRMQKRCNIEELTYLTTTLSIISKTGGNTKEVFNYLEDLFQTRKSLNQELDASIASAKLVYYILSIIPLVIFIGMFIIYDNYINIYLSSPIGNIIGGVEILLYLVYVIVIRKIMIIDKY